MKKGGKETFEHSRKAKSQPRRPRSLVMQKIDTDLRRSKSHDEKFQVRGTDFRSFELEVTLEDITSTKFVCKCVS